LSEKNSFIPEAAFSRSLCDPLSTAAFFSEEKELSFISLDYEKLSKGDRKFVLIERTLILIEFKISTMNFVYDEF